MAQPKNAKPLQVFRSGTVSASVWRNETEKNGQIVVRHSVSIRKQYKKDDGSYENTNQYFPDELMRLAMVAQKAFEFLCLKGSGDADDTAPT